MVTREQLINKLKAIGYRFKRAAWRVDFFKRGTHLAAVPKRDILEDATVVHMLQQCSVTPEEIREFLRNCSN